MREAIAWPSLGSSCNRVRRSGRHRSHWPNTAFCFRLDRLEVSRGVVSKRLIRVGRGASDPGNSFPRRSRARHAWRPKRPTASEIASGPARSAASR